MKSLGLYLHIPFCATKCSYCDFPSYEGQMHQRDAYVEKLLKEMAQRGAALARPLVDSVYIGGGTPSVLMPRHMEALLQGLHRHFAVAEDCEISCEANPGTLTERFLSALRTGGVNRLSLGAQSADAALLSLLGRAHSWRQVESAVALARAAGFENINIDLMLGIPTQTERVWADTLESALALAPEHLSCYGLIVEEGTPLAAQIASGALALPDPAVERAMYDHTLHTLAQSGYEQYEVSNFAKPGRACRHNVHCWQRQDYLGLGAAAHGLWQDTRTENPAAIAAYLAGEPPRTQVLTHRERQFESVMLGLRMTEGLSLPRFEQMHGVSFQAVYGEAAAPSLQAGLTEYAANHFRLTRAGMDLMNRVLLDFL